ncbi:MAG: PAS domain-containing protein [Alphaproteobacteria bacterium]|nr:PAS domain-containing protein [Alphaproteobacteria bacterium]
MESSAIKPIMSASTGLEDATPLAERKATEQVLRDREEQLRLATEAADVGLWDVDVVADRLFWPPCVKAMFGISPEVPVSMADFYAGLHPEDRERVSKAYAAALDPKRQALYDVEYRTVGKEDGLIRWVAAKGRGIFDGSGRCVRVIGTAIDISERKRAEAALRASEQLLRLATDAAKIGAFEWNMKTGANTWTPQLEAMYGLAPGTFAGTQADWVQLVHEEDRSGALTKVEEALRSGEPVEHEWRVVWPDGTVHWIFGRFQALGDQSGTPLRLTGVNLDITARKHAEMKLQAADRQKDEFLAMLAHELRNPLAPISTASELLIRTVDGEQAQAVINMIKRQCAQLTRLVDDLLDVSRITHGRIPLKRQPVDLASILTQAIESVGPQLREKRHKISALSSGQMPLYVNGDIVRLVQCATNILTNAIKYTEPGGEISIRVYGDDASAFIEVADSGVGIAPELLPRVFDVFVQSERTLDRSQGGLGIGLAVVKRLIEMHDGEVTAHSSGLGRGSTFQIRLPRIPAPDGKPAAEVAFKAKPRRVLIVDDNLDAATSLAMLLDIEGHQTRVAYSAREALAGLDAFEPEVVLLDIGLPEMSGYELASRLRTMPQMHGVRLVALTGYGQTEDRQLARSAGFDDHLVKPVEMAALQRTLAGFPGDEAVI